MDKGKMERKVIQGGFWGSVTIIIVWGVSLVGLNIPTEVAQAMTIVFSTAAGYYAK